MSQEISIPIKGIRRNIVIALGIICTVLVAALVGSFAYYFLMISERNNTISSLNSQISQLNTQISQLNTQISQLNTQISTLNSTISSLSSTKNVNVTNWPTQLAPPSYALAEADLNISFSSYWGGASFPAPTNTQGLSKLFIHMTQLAWSYSFPEPTTVYLSTIRWVWGTGIPYGYYELAHERSFSTEDTPLKQTSYAEPGFSWHSESCNFTVEATAFYCSFTANSAVETGWVLIRVQLYLTN